MQAKCLLVFCMWNGFTTISTLSDLKFPDDFIFGASTSSYQIEGAWNVDGKGISIWDTLTHDRPNVTRGQNGDEAAESYYLYGEDSDLMKETGLKLYRFSISWTRILPNGDLSEINHAGLDHYDRVVDDLIEKGIEPMATIYHWDLPQKLQNNGGWLNSSTIDYVTEFADLLFNRYGDRVKLWITINEPYLVTLGYYDDDTLAPSLGLGTPADYQVSHNLLLAHASIYRLYERKYKRKQSGKLSISLNYAPCYPKTDSKEDIEAANRQNQFALGIYAHPIYSAKGNYPKLVRDIVNRNSKAEGLRQPKLMPLTKKEISALRGSGDFFALNLYSSFVCSEPLANSTQNQNAPPFPFSTDVNAQLEANASLPLMQPSNLPIDPTALRVALRQISEQYNYPEIFVTENGYGDEAGELHDLSRIQYIANYLQELLDAYHYDKCKVIGYSVWSLMDNFQWLDGYDSKYGLYYVDFNSKLKTRIPRTSSRFMRDLVRERQIPNPENYSSS